MKLNLSLTNEEIGIILKGIILLAKLPESQPQEMAYYLSLFNKIQIQITNNQKENNT